MKKASFKLAMAALGLLVYFFGPGATPVYALTSTWTGVTGDWSNAGNWTDGVPGAGDDAVINSGSALLASDTAVLASLTMNGGTLTFTNWTTKLTATTVAIQNGAQITLPGAFNDTTDMSNRVWIVCTNMFIAAGGSINVNQKGYSAPSSASAGYGPGKGGARAGGAYGGFGGNYANVGGRPYGATNAPTDPGSGGGGDGVTYGGKGGGAVRIEATGTVTVNGTITANGQQAAVNAGSGSGGGIYITCNTFAATNGVITADGSTVTGTAGNGGGGRIAVIYDATAQSNAASVSARFSARPGVTGSTYPSDIGSLYFPDNQFLGEVVPHSGRWIVPGFTNWTPGSLFISNGWIRFESDGMRIAVMSNLIINGSLARLDMGGNAFFTNIFPNGYYLNYLVYSDISGNQSLKVGGDLLLTNSGALYIYSGMTNSGTPDYGALVAVTGDLTVAAGAVIYPASHPTNGGSVLFRMANLNIAAGGQINANEIGFAPGKRDSYLGYGPGAGTGARGGAGYGGMGGNYDRTGGPTYGSYSAPVHPGSGGCNYTIGTLGGSGGGLVRVEATNTITVNGTITANGSANVGSNAGGGSGGGIYLACKVFAGVGGVVRVNGGRGSSSAGNGGGGRIAVVYDPAQQTNAPLPNVSFFAQAGSGASYLAYPGALYFSDKQLLPEVITNIQAELVGFDSWSPGRLILTNSLIRFPADGFNLTVASNVVVDGASARLEIGGGNAISNKYWDIIYTEKILYSATGQTFHCGGNVVLTNGGRLYIYSGPTNAAGVFTNYGALVSVTGDLTVASNSWIYPISEATNGGSVFMRMRNLTLTVGGGINADRHGFCESLGPGKGVSRGGGGYGGGGGYPGGGNTYGSSNAPVEPGSGGGPYGGSSPGGPAGGLVWIRADNKLTLDGTITADGNRNGGSNAGGGSGGGIYLTCATLLGSGSGALGATGGGGAGGGVGGSGGGGRIAVWRQIGETNAFSTDVSGGFDEAYSGTNGTVVWGWIPRPQGTMFVVK